MAAGLELGPPSRPTSGALDTPSEASGRMDGDGAPAMRLARSESSIIVQPGEEMPRPIAAVKTLLGVIDKSKAVTIMGLEAEVKEATEELKAREKEATGGRTPISLTAACELFFRYVTRPNDDAPDFETLKRGFVSRGKRKINMWLKARAKIAEFGHHFVQDGMVVLTLGRSRVVHTLLRRAAETKNFTVIVTEGRPDGSGYKAAELYAEVGIPVTVILDSAVGYVMEKVDIVILGAEGVLESGGIVNKIGTCQTALVAKAFTKPLYVATESYKFARLYPLNQSDIPDSKGDQRPLEPWQPDLLKDRAGVATENPACDYTPADCITLLFTDLGILTPAAVSDELIRLYQ